ncbi:TlpA family protein disulfide reductase [Mucilaginibacter pocheonensis]|uniref:Thiol-disulfide isomerase/thioredoxin n=1 Tax=Mucilaginibacter pocheonensis TaxID=398050 RepID=A0ABU1TEM0_9SPHI|nr:TlpA disulfide reductase family protein [Mucilaginibacter pocheonensis]MDR6943699.1 thiol-disulfide isomerase/thioredoxin [Mucilaginibacter pocheonensis]
MKKITILIVMAVLCHFFTAKAQSTSIIKLYKVGDTLPDLTINKVVNFKSKTIHLADFKDRLVILDFWDSYCGPCIEHMPKIYALQRHFGAKIFMLPVDPYKGDTPERIQAFFNKRKASFDLPSVTVDTILNKMFRPKSLGVYIWIQNGIVKAITEAEDVTEKNISLMLDSGLTAVAHIDTARFHAERPFPINGFNGSKPPVYIYRSIFTPYIKGVHGSGMMLDSSDKVYRIYHYAETPQNLLLSAFPEFSRFVSGFLKIKVANLNEFKSSRKPAADSNWYNYEAIFPPTTKQRAFKYFQQDLAKYLPFKIDSVRLNDSVWVLKRSLKHRPITSGPKEKDTNLFDVSNSPLFFSNMPVKRILYDFQNYYKEPFIDETDFNQNVWLKLPVDRRNFTEIAKSLEDQGFTLIKEPRELEYAVISDKSPQ